MQPVNDRFLYPVVQQSKSSPDEKQNSTFTFFLLTACTAVCAQPV